MDDWARRIARHPRDALVTAKAVHQMALDSLGGTQQFWRGTVGHTLGTNLRFEPDEFNFLRERSRRRDRGPRSGSAMATTATGPATAEGRGGDPPGRDVLLDPELLDLPMR